MRGTLANGIHVFGITDARHTSDGRAARNAELRELCRLESSCPRDDNAESGGRGRFHLASPQVTTLGTVRSVVDIPHFDGRAASLGFAAACIPPIPRADTDEENSCPKFGPRQENFYCEQLLPPKSGDMPLAGTR